MTYLKLTRARVILLCFLIASAVVLRFPDIDLYIAGMFFNGSFYMQGQWWEQALHHGVGLCLYAATAVVIALYAFNRIAGAKVWGIDGPKVLYLLLVLAVGAGLLVNTTLKDNFGRARPRDVQEFGGPKQFTPAFVVSDQCSTNCSFSSGDAAGAFFSLSLAMVFGRRRILFIASLLFGAAVSISRMAAGAHFFSDILVSFFVMLITADVLYHYMLLPKPVAHRATEPVLVSS
jgi:lipid A 4'-phosphatase